MQTNRTLYGVYWIYELYPPSGGSSQVSCFLTGDKRNSRHKHPSSSYQIPKPKQYNHVNDLNEEQRFWKLDCQGFFFFFFFSMLNHCAADFDVIQMRVKGKWGGVSWMAVANEPAQYYRWLKCYLLLPWANNENRETVKLHLHQTQLGVVC